MSSEHYLRGSLETILKAIEDGFTFDENGNLKTDATLEGDAVVDVEAVKLEDQDGNIIATPATNETLDEVLKSTDLTFDGTDLQVKLEADGVGLATETTLDTLVKSDMFEEYKENVEESLQRPQLTEYEYDVDPGDGYINEMPMDLWDSLIISVDSVSEKNVQVDVEWIEDDSAEANVIFKEEDVMQDKQKDWVELIGKTKWAKITVNDTVEEGENLVNIAIRAV